MTMCVWKIPTNKSHTQIRSHVIGQACDVNVFSNTAACDLLALSWQTRRRDRIEGARMLLLLLAVFVHVLNAVCAPPHKLASLDSNATQPDVADVSLKVTSLLCPPNADVEMGRGAGMFSTMSSRAFKGSPLLQVHSIRVHALYFHSHPPGDTLDMLSFWLQGSW